MAVKLYIARDYSEEGFWQAWAQHTADWGEPDLVYSDKGSQLVSAAGGLDPDDEEDKVDWATVSWKTRGLRLHRIYNNTKGNLLHAK